LKANYNEDTVKLRPTADNASATVKINGNTVGRGGEFAMFLQPGENTAAIEVTAQSGASRRYNVIIDRSRFPDADALDLSSLSTSLKDSISPVFNPKHTLYFVNARVDEEAVTITARPKRPGSSVVMINGATTEQKRVRLYSGLNEIIIRVDIDEKHSNTYKLTIDKEYN